MRRVRVPVVGVFIAILLISYVVYLPVASANLEQMKIYKSVFEEKAKCTWCHVDKLPKKEEGKHEWNEYGLKLRKVKATPDAETYKTVGKCPAKDDE